MPRGALIAVRIAGFLFLGFALLAFFGSGRADDVVDKEALYLSAFLIHFPLVAWLTKRETPASPVRRKVFWSIIGVVAGLIGGYLLWNAMLYITIELIRGGGATQSGPLRAFSRDRFDFRASWGVLFLAVSLALLVASLPGQKARQDRHRMSAQSNNKKDGETQ